MSAGQFEAGFRVIKLRGIYPVKTLGVMAFRTGGIKSAFVKIFMTGSAVVEWQRGKCLHALTVFASRFVTLAAFQLRVCAAEFKICFCVVEEHSWRERFAAVAFRAIFS
jgi:hypothetical protein